MNYKSLVFAIAQAGTSAPVAADKENQVGSVIWSRNSAGSYVGTSAGLFTLGKTIIPSFGDWNGNGNPYLPLMDGSTVLGYYSVYPDNSNPNLLNMEVIDAGGTHVDLSTLVDTTSLFIEVRVYN